LLAIGDVRDEINFNTQKAISRIERLAYTPENLEDVIASGRPYETDTNYIYCVRASYVETDIAIDGTYTVSDHGIEFYTATTTTPPVTECIYGNNLKDKLRMDVLTISAQNLSAAQQAQVQTNIDVPSTANMVARDTALQNQITTLNSNIETLQNNQVKYMDIADTTPVNVNSKSGQVVTVNTFIGCATQTNGVLPLPYTNNGIQYIKLVNYNDLSAFSGSATIRVWYR
jgi:hypothetical protein